MNNRIFVFSNNRISVKEIIEKGNNSVILSKKYDSLSLKLKDSEIIPLNKYGKTIDDENELIAGFFIVSETYEILKYLYNKHKLLFMDQDYLSLVTHLDPIKDRKYYNNIINEYTYECMLHMGIINNLSDIEDNVLNGEKFYNTYIIEKSQLIRCKRARWHNFKSKVKENINKFISIFKTKK